jgi:hypothetical protein
MCFISCFFFFFFGERGVIFVEDKAESDQPPRDVGIAD